MTDNDTPLRRIRTREPEVYFPCPSCGVTISDRGVPTHVGKEYCRAKIARDAARGRGLVALDEDAAPRYAAAGVPLEWLETAVAIASYDPPIERRLVKVAWARPEDIARACGDIRAANEVTADVID